MSEKKDKPKKQVRNRTRDMIADYVITNQQITRDYDEKFAKDKEERKKTGKKHEWTYTEKLYTGVIIVCLVLIFVRYVILKI